MKVLRYLLAGGAMVLAASLCAGAARAAETKLTELNGSWHGSGTDRNTPLESSQATNCHATIHATAETLTDQMTCNGQAGLHQVIHLSVRVKNDVISGSLSQTSTTQGADPATREGSVSGTRSGDTANFVVHFSGLTPSASVELNLTSPSSFSMHASSLGATLMDVRFRR